MVQAVRTIDGFMVDVTCLWIKCTAVADMFNAIVWVGTVLGTLLVPLVADKPAAVLCTAE